MGISVWNTKARTRAANLRRDVTAFAHLRRVCRDGKRLDLQALSEKHGLPKDRLRYAARDPLRAWQRAKAKLAVVQKSNEQDMTAVELHRSLMRDEHTLSLRSIQRYCKLPRRRRIIKRKREARLSA
jgi:hypothetical protein